MTSRPPGNLPHVSVTVRPLSSAEHLDLIRSRPSVSFLQTPAWARVKTEWRSESLGIFDGSEPLGAGAVELPGVTVPVPPAAGVVTDEPGLFVAEPVPDFVLPEVVFEPWLPVAGLPGFAGGTSFVRTGESVPFVSPTRGMPVTAMPRR